MKQNENGCFNLQNLSLLSFVMILLATDFNLRENELRKAQELEIHLENTEYKT